MKSLLIILLLSQSVLLAEDKAITPRIGESFGTKMVIEGIFVEKNRTYFEQNLIKTKYMLQIIKVNGAQLAEPQRIEYRWEKEESVEEGKAYQLDAYESLYTLGDPKEWNEFPSQIDYRVNTYLVIRKPKS